MSESTTPESTPHPRMAVQNLYIPDPSVDEIDLSINPSWMVATVIDDDDLMFGGKPLCAWYEEDRRRFGCATFDEEETRGRPRERVRIDAHYERSQKQSHHQARQQHHQQPLQPQPQPRLQQQRQHHHRHRSSERSLDMKEE
ncbi:hypothetical protein VTH82DRAFT_6966 [Thermothelomyces myriococcoides]